MIKFFSDKNFWKQAALILGCLFFFGCENDQKLIDEWTNDKVMVEEAIDIETFLSQGSKMKAKLWAPYMLRYQSDTQYVEFPRKLHVNFFDTSGRVESHLDALYGKYYENLNKVYLRDSVIVYNMIGDTLQSPELWWDQALQKFYTDKPVRIVKGGNIIFGKSLEAKQDLSDINIRQVSNSTVLVPDSLQ